MSVTDTTQLERQAHGYDYYDDNNRLHRPRTPLRAVAPAVPGATLVLPQTARLTLVRSTRTAWHLPQRRPYHATFYSGAALCGAEPPKAWGKSNAWDKTRLVKLADAFAHGVCSECLARRGFDRDVVRLAREGKTLLGTPRPDVTRNWNRRYSGKRPRP